MELQVWEGDYGLVSIDMECLKMILYMKVAQVPFGIVHVRNANIISSKSLPILRSGGFQVTRYEKCVEHLRFKRFNVDLELSQKQCSEVHALTAYTREYLEPMLEYTMWLDRRNYEELIGPWYMKLMVPLVNSIYTRKRRRNAWNIIHAFYNNCEDMEIIEGFLKAHAKECLENLSKRLSSKPYFFGEKPSSLDCTVYALLAPLLKIPFPNTEIQKLVRAYANLVNLVHRLDKNYLSEQINEVQVRRRPFQLDECDKKDCLSSGLKMVTFVCVACTMLGYAMVNKILPLKL